MRQTTALLGLAVDGAPGAVDAAQAVADRLAAEGRIVAVHLARGGRLRCVAATGAWVVEDGIPPTSGAVGRCHQTGSEVVGAAAAGGAVADPPGPGATCLPLIADGRTVGVLELRSPAALASDDLDQARACAAILARRLAAEPNQPSGDRARRLVRHLVDMAALRDGHAIVGTLLGAAIDLVPLRSAVLVCVTAPPPHTTAAIGPLADVLRAADLRPIAARAGSGSVVTTGRHDKPAPDDLADLRAAGVESLVAVALRADGELTGVLVLASSERAHVETDDVELLEQLAAHAAACLTTAELLQALSDRAASDPLTGLGHHATFHEALAGSHRRPRTAVVVCDLDGFKGLNDTHGHAHGDRMLCAVADAMSSALRRGDRLFRIGGDEFAALLAVESDEEALDAATRLRDAVIGAQLGVTVSIGVAVPGDGETDASLLARADRALYAVKDRGRDGVALAPHAPAHAGYRG
jgi:diguanylate cyclase (GGDEF)-like protein